MVDYHRASTTPKARAAHDWRPGHRYREDQCASSAPCALPPSSTRWASRSSPRPAKPLVGRVAGRVPQSRCSTKCSSCCRPAMPGLHRQLQSWGWIRASTRCWTWWWSAPSTVRARRLAWTTDRRVGEAKTVAPSFCWPACWGGRATVGWEQRLNRGEHAFPALQDAIDEGVRQAHRRRLRARQTGSGHARDLGHAAALLKSVRAIRHSA